MFVADIDRFGDDDHVHSMTGVVCDPYVGK